MRKQIFAIVMVIALAVALSVTAFAAEGITEKEQALLDKFKAGAALIPTPASYITQAEEILAKEDLTDKEIADLSDAIDSIFAKINDTGAATIGELRESEGYAAIVTEIQAAAAKIGYEVEPGDPATTGAIIKQTGSEAAVTVAIIALLSVALVASFVVVGKKNLFAAQA